MLRTAAFLFACVVASGTATAQVYKCPDKASGRIVYSDAPCSEGKQIIRPMTDEERAANAERASLTRERVQLDRERAALRQEQDAMRAPSPPPASAPPASPPPIDAFACQKARRELSIASNLQSASPEGKRRRMNTAIVEVNAACGTKTELIQEPARVTVEQNRGPVVCHGAGNTLVCN